MNKRLTTIIAVAMAFILAACGSSATPSAADTTSAAESTTGEGRGAGDSSAEPVTLKVFSNLPERTSDQGLVEQTIFDQYMAENPGVTIEVEALDDEAYKTKFKAYAAGSQMPDLVSVWGQPGFIDEIIAAGVLAPLNESDYTDYGFIPGALDGFSADGTLYGLARNTDVMAFFYNEKIFDDNGWEVPTSYDELLALADKAKKAGIVAVAMDGSDKWPLSIFITDLMEQIDGDGVMGKTHDAIENADFSDPTFEKACALFQQAAAAGLFQNGFETADYGTAKNLFVNGQAAMLYMGSWEMSMVTSEDTPSEVRDHIRMFTMPAVEGGKGSSKNIAAWNGGGYSVTESSANKEEAIKLLNYMFLPENWTRIAWENGVCMSAQDFSAYATGTETEVQKQFMTAFSEAEGISGTPINDMGTSLFKSTCEDLTQQLAIGQISPKEFLDGIAAVCK